MCLARWKPKASWKRSMLWAKTTLLAYTHPSRSTIRPVTIQACHQARNDWSDAAALADEKSLGCFHSNPADPIMMMTSGQIAKCSQRIDPGRHHRHHPKLVLLHRWRRSDCSQQLLQVGVGDHRKMRVRALQKSGRPSCSSEDCLVATWLSAGYLWTVKAGWCRERWQVWDWDCWQAIILRLIRCDRVASDAVCWNEQGAWMAWERHCPPFLLLKSSCCPSCFRGLVRV